MLNFRTSHFRNLKENAVQIPISARSHFIENERARFLKQKKRKFPFYRNPILSRRPCSRTIRFLVRKSLVLTIIPKNFRPSGGFWGAVGRRPPCPPSGRGWPSPDSGRPSFWRFTVARPRGRPWPTRSVIYPGCE